MPTAEQTVRGGGPVAVESVSFVVRELTVAAEVELLNRFRALAREALGPGSFYRNSRPVAAWLREQGDHAAAASLLEVTGRLVATGAGAADDLADEFRRSPAGVAEELFWRTRETHPDATREEFRAVVTAVNALEVHLRIMEALDPKKAETPSTSPGSS